MKVIILKVIMIIFMQRGGPSSGNVNLFFYLMMGLFFCFGSHANAQEKTEKELAGKAKVLAVSEAYMCEEILNTQPKNKAVVFSITLEKVICYTAFDPVPAKGFIYHKWYHQDKLNRKTRLTLNPPRWATFSRIQLREADKGPWRVEVADENDKVFQVLRFSVVD
jgi:hypothetical protein